MLKSIRQNVMARLGTALLLCSAASLAGCSVSEKDDFVDPRATAYYDRYPIEVRKAPVKLGVSGHTGVLQPEQVNEVANFARDARDNASSRVTVHYPSASARSRQLAMDIASLMVDQGVPQSMIRVGSYRGGADAPVQVSFERKVAVTRECGDWSTNLAHDPQNRDFPNLGCAYQNNVAAMVDNPEDFLHPRAMGPISSANRVAAMVIYYKSPTSVTSSSTTNTTISNSVSSSTNATGG